MCPFWHTFSINISLAKQHTYFENVMDIIYFLLLIWRPANLSELTPYQIQSKLTLLGSTVNKYSQFRIFNLLPKNWTNLNETNREIPMKTENICLETNIRWVLLLIFVYIRQEFLPKVRFINDMKCDQL